MKNDLELSNFFQCPHHNTGYCKFHDQCRYEHFFTRKSVCRENKCQNRHPKTCKNGEKCRFHVLKACAYKHSIETEVIESLQKEIESLCEEISQLKNIVRIKEDQSKENLKDKMEN